MKIILASASPRRTQLLSQIGLAHIVIPSDCEEIITKEIPEEVVMELSETKAKSVYQEYAKEHTDDFIVIGSDTVVAFENHILGKPKDGTDAYQMLDALQGHTHQVYTGVTLLLHNDGKEKQKIFYECSQVNVYPMTGTEIKSYIETKEPMDKAGAYGIQGRFAAYIKGIDGDYNNIVGLPVAKLYQEIKHLTNTI